MAMFVIWWQFMLIVVYASCFDGMALLEPPSSHCIGSLLICSALLLVSIFDSVSSPSFSTDSDTDGWYQIDQMVQPFLFHISPFLAACSFYQPSLNRSMIITNHGMLVEKPLSSSLPFHLLAESSDLLFHLLKPNSQVG